eukprot:1990351-Pleurochrysis_carterae.AAC.1
MALVLGIKTIPVPHSTLSATLAQRKPTTTSSHNALLTTTAFTSTLTLPGTPTTPTSRTSACLPTASSIGALAFSKLSPVPAKLRQRSSRLCFSHAEHSPQPSRPSP